MTDKETKEVKEITVESDMDYLEISRSEGFGKPALAIILQSNKKDTKFSDLVAHAKTLIKLVEDERK